MNEIYEFEYNALQEMLIVNYQENFSYSMCNEDDVYSVAEKLNELQSTISRLEEENEQLKHYKLYEDNKRLQTIIADLKKENEHLRQMIKENVFQQYSEGSLADLKFKAIAYDDIIKLEISNESEPKVMVYCNYGKRENVMSFCQMFIPFGIVYEIKEVIDDE